MVKLVVKLDLCATELNAEATLVQGQIFPASVFVLLYLVQKHKY